MINVYNFVYIYLCYHHHNLGNKHYHHLQKFSCVCWFCFIFTIIMQPEIYPFNKLLSTHYLIVNCRHYIYRGPLKRIPLM